MSSLLDEAKKIVANVKSDVKDIVKQTAGVGTPTKIKGKTRDYEIDRSVSEVAGDGHDSWRDKD